MSPTAGLCDTRTLAKGSDRVDFIALAKGNDAPPDEVLNGVHLFRIKTRSFQEKSKFVWLFGILDFFFRTMSFLLWRPQKVRSDLLKRSFPE
jgi:hypothetical protein